MPPDAPNWGMDDRPQGVASSPYEVRAIASPARVAGPDATRERLRAIAEPDASFVPVPATGEYYDVRADARRALAPEQLVPADRDLLAAIRPLADHPFLLVTPEGDDDPSVGDLDEDRDYWIVTPADLNRRTAEAAIYPVVATVEERLATLVEREYPDPEALVRVVGPFPVGVWTKARAGDVDVHLAEFCTLTDLVGVCKGNDRLLARLGYDDPDRLESDLYGIGELRNRVAHGNRSLVLEPADVATHIERIDTALRLIARIDEEIAGEASTS